MSTKILINAVRDVIRLNPQLAHGAEPGKLVLSPRGMFVEFYYPVVIDGQFEIVPNIFDLINEVENAAKHG